MFRSDANKDETRPTKSNSSTKDLEKCITRAVLLADSSDPLVEVVEAIAWCSYTSKFK